MKDWNKVKLKHKVMLGIGAGMFWWGAITTAIFGYVSYSQKEVELLPVAIGLFLVVAGFLLARSVSKSTKEGTFENLVNMLFLNL